MKSIEKSPVIIFGGAFNPPTSAHVDIIEACLSLPGFDELWVMPSGDRRDKQMDVSDEDRLNMLGLVRREVFEDNPRLVISDFELKLPRPNQTYITVGKLAAEHADIDFWFTYGADAYASMPEWTHGVELQEKLQMIIFGRGSIDIPSREEIIKLDVDSCDGISSSRARANVTEGQPLDNLVCSSVARYIEQNKLYT
ncbi:MAG TPA: nicotinate (nicotinamide) nucleotide adenylyltransferase [Candidatus Saccharimonadales bacterium]